jgi:hypothetical protein
MKMLKLSLGVLALGLFVWPLEFHSASVQNPTQP